MERLILDWSELLTTATVSTSLFVSLILIAKGSSQPLNNRLIGFCLLIINIFVIMTILITKGYAIEFPWLLRFFSPIYFLIGPILYFYIRQAIIGQKITFKQDFIHFLPAFLHFIDLLPFYFLPLEEKRQIAITLFENPKLILSMAGGVLPINFWNLLRTTLIIIYSTTALIMVFRNKAQTLARANGWGMHLFMVTISIIFWLGNFFGSLNILIINEIIPLQNGVSSIGNGITFYFELFVLISLLGINFMFFFLPESTFGLPLPTRIEPENNVNLMTNRALYAEVEEIEEKKKALEEESITETDPQLSDKEKKILYQLLYGMETEQWYRQKNFNADTCCERLGCEKHVLGRIFHKAIKKRFSDFVNEYRVSFVIEEIRADKLKNFTLEGLSEQAGFNSRITFYNAFVKQKGMSPSKFIADISKIPPA